MPAMNSGSTLSFLECSRCGQQHAADQVQQLCKCGGPLLARYDLARAKQTFTPQELATRNGGLWKYRELLPVEDIANVISLGETMTPLIALAKVGEKLRLSGLLLKDEGLLPSGSFKARGAAVGISRAHELGVQAFAMPTNGNAGAAWTSYAAKAGLRSYIVMPERAPAIHRAECVLAGASVFSVNGSISDAGKIVAKAVARHGLYDASTLKEPYRVEGKKTLGFEIAEQLGWKLPDVIIYPTGGGVGLIGMYKAFTELQELGIVQSRMPRFVAVQSTGCAPIVEAWRQQSTVSQPWSNPSTVAFGINVPKALGDFLILNILYRSNGAAIAVDDSDILAHQRLLAESEGVMTCPEGAATLAGAIAFAQLDRLRPDDLIVLVNTGRAMTQPGVTPEVVMLQPDDELPIFVKTA